MKACAKMAKMSKNDNLAKSFLIIASSSFKDPVSDYVGLAQVSSQKVRTWQQQQQQQQQGQLHQLERQPRQQQQNDHKRPQLSPLNDLRLNYLRNSSWLYCFKCWNIVGAFPNYRQKWLSGLIWSRGQLLEMGISHVVYLWTQYSQEVSLIKIKYFILNSNWC